MVYGRREPLIAAAVALLLATSACKGGQAYADASCTTSGPTTGAFTVIVCIETPPNDSELSQDSTVTATAVLSKHPPSIRQLEFSLDGTYLLTDGTAPYTFTLPIGTLAEGEHVLEARAVTSGGFRSQAATVNLTLSPEPAASLSFAPRGVAAHPSPIVVAAVGDGASWTPASTKVSTML